MSCCSITWVGAVVLAMVLVARADDDIRTYTVPKEHPSLAVPANPSVAAPEIPVSTGPIRWTVPDGWRELAPTAIRIGNFAVPGKNGAKAEVTVTSFPGTVGTELDNVNRWRGELQLPPVDDSGVSSQPVTVDSFDGKVFDLSGTSARTVVAMVSRNGAMWFFKMRGDTEVVGAARPAFFEFLKSVRFSDATDAKPAPVAAAPTAPAAPADSAPDGPKWQVPADWTEAEPGPMIFKRYSVSDADGAKAAITVSFFPGSVGGALANVNRWRGQMGLQPLQSDQLAGATETFETADGTATLVDFSGQDAKTAKPARLIGVILPHEDKTWFFKLLGDGPVVGREKDSFVNFVKSAHIQ
jgi:hypothetical protein